MYINVSESIEETDEFHATVYVFTPMSAFFKAGSLCLELSFTAG